MCDEAIGGGEAIGCGDAITHRMFKGGGSGSRCDCMKTMVAKTNWYLTSEASHTLSKLLDADRRRGCERPRRKTAHAFGLRSSRFGHHGDEHVEEKHRREHHKHK
jgi:hypothetical protein